MSSTGFPSFAVAESQTFRNFVPFATDGNFSISSSTGVHCNSLRIAFPVSYSALWVNVHVFKIVCNASLCAQEAREASLIARAGRWALVSRNTHFYKELLGVCASASSTLRASVQPLYAKTRRFTSSLNP